MLLAVDIGNSNVVWSVWAGRKWTHQERFETHPVDGKRYEQTLNHFWAETKLNNTNISTIVISSVVPVATQPFFDALRGILTADPIVINGNMDTGISVETDHPENVGADLIADAVGAYHLIQNTCIVIDFGTATTVMAVEKTGKLQGVAICAGLNPSKEALTAKAAQLFDVPLQPPPSVLGKNTTEAMQSGLVLGHLSMVEGLIDRVKQETGPAKVVATGGFAEMLAPHTDAFDRVEPMLTLDGLRIIAERQATDRSRQ